MRTIRYHRYSVLALLLHALVVTLLLLTPLTGGAPLLVRTTHLASHPHRLLPTTMAVPCYHVILPWPLLLTYLLGEIWGASHAAKAARDATLATLLVALAVPLLGMLPTATDSPAPAPCWNLLFEGLPTRTFTCLATYHLGCHLQQRLLRWHAQSMPSPPFTLYYLLTTLLAGTTVVTLTTQLLHVGAPGTWGASMRLLLGSTGIAGIVHFLCILATYLLPLPTAGVLLPERPTYRALVATFCTFLLLTNLVASKWVALGPYSVTASLFTYPLTFLVTDLLTELYGKRNAHHAVVGGLATTGAMLLCLATLRSLLAWHRSPYHPAYVRFFAFTPSMVGASLLAYTCSQWLDLHLFARLQAHTHGRHLWLRNNVATILSQLLDTCLFALLAWPLLALTTPATCPPWQGWALLSCREYGCKVVLALLDTPLLYLALRLLRPHR